MHYKALYREVESKATLSEQVSIELLQAQERIQSLKLELKEVKRRNFRANMADAVSPGANTEASASPVGRGVAAMEKNERLELEKAALEADLAKVRKKIIRIIYGSALSRSCP